MTANTFHLYVTTPALAPLLLVILLVNIQAKLGRENFPASRLRATMIIFSFDPLTWMSLQVKQELTDIVKLFAMLETHELINIVLMDMVDDMGRNIVMDDGVGATDRAQFPRGEELRPVQRRRDSGKCGVRGRGAGTGRRFHIVFLYDHRLGNEAV